MQGAVKSKPVLFNAGEVKATLDGRKTVMRRDPFHFSIKPGYNPDWSGYSLGEYFTGHIETGVCLYSRGAHDVWGVRSNVVKPRYQVGDVLWVRETWTTEYDGIHDDNGYGRYVYKADGETLDVYEGSSNCWRPSIHMPREAARIFLKVTDVRVERLQDITLEGCISEGITDGYNATSEKHHEALAERAYPVIFSELWDSTIKKKTLNCSDGMLTHGYSCMSLRGAPMKRKKLSKAERIEIHSKTDGHCAYCGIEIEIADMQVDHVFPINRGGLDAKENMLPACRSCNHYKSTYDLEDFREEIGKWHERLIRDSVTYKNAVRFGVVTPTPRKVEFYFERCENAV